MTLLAKNSPCPCESGKKYKRCCHARHQKMDRDDLKRTRGIGEILNWLLGERGAESLAAIDRGFLGVIPEEDRSLLERMPEHFRNILMNNAYEWLLLEAKIFTGGGMEPVREIVLGPGGPPSVGELERDWFQRAVGVPVAAYEIVEVHRGLGASVSNLADRDAAPIRITQPATWENFRVGDHLGLRLLRDGDIWVRSAAGYGFAPQSVPDIEQAILQARSEETDPVRQAQAIGDRIRDLWTQLAFASFRGPAEAEPTVN